LSFSHSWFITRFVTRITWRVSTLPEDPSSPPVFSGVCVAWSLVFYVVLCRSLFVFLFFFFWPLYCLSFFDSPFGIFKLFLSLNNFCLTPSEPLFVISWREESTFRWDDDNTLFVLDQHAALDIYLLAHWNKSLLVNMSLHTLSWLIVKHFFPSRNNAVCFVEN
jgi:hypothetical protein